MLARGWLSSGASFDRVLAQREQHVLDAQPIVLTVQCVTVEQAAHAANAFAGRRGLFADQSEDFAGLFDGAFPLAENALAGLREGDAGAQRLVQFMRNAAGHFFQYRIP